MFSWSSSVYWGTDEKMYYNIPAVSKAYAPSKSDLMQFFFLLLVWFVCLFVCFFNTMLLLKLLEEFLSGGRVEKQN